MSLRTDNSAFRFHQTSPHIDHESTLPLPASTLRYMTVLHRVHTFVEIAWYLARDLLGIHWQLAPWQSERPKISISQHSELTISAFKCAPNAAGRQPRIPEIPLTTNRSQFRAYERQRLRESRWGRYQIANHVIREKRQMRRDRERVRAESLNLKSQSPTVLWFPLGLVSSASKCSFLEMSAQMSLNSVNAQTAVASVRRCSSSFHCTTFVAGLLPLMACTNNPITLCNNSLFRVLPALFSLFWAARIREGHQNLNQKLQKDWVKS